MSQPDDAAALGGAVTFLTIAAQAASGLHYHAACGALIGSFFFLTLPSNVQGFKGFLLWIVSIGFGYYSGFFVSTSDYWQSIKAANAAGGFVALLMGALGAGILTSIQKYVDGGPMPDFLERILDRVPFLKGKRGQQDA